MTDAELIRKTELGGLRAVASLEFAKGVLAVLVAFGLIALSRSDRDISDVVDSLLHDLHIGPDGHLGHVLLHQAARLDSINLIGVAFMVFAYASLRFVEAYGLWRARVWAEWVALLSGLIYLPLEIRHLIHRPGPISWIVLLVNVGIVAYMAYLRFFCRIHPEQCSTNEWPSREQRAETE